MEIISRKIDIAKNIWVGTGTMCDGDIDATRHINALEHRICAIKSSNKIHTITEHLMNTKFFIYRYAFIASLTRIYVDTHAHLHT